MSRRGGADLAGGASIRVPFLLVGQGILKVKVRQTTAMLYKVNTQHEGAAVWKKFLMDRCVSYIWDE